jgi:8-oxo-dGTP pyrophosphatase MutT (NUDIX family)
VSRAAGGSGGGPGGPGEPLGEWTHVGDERTEDYGIFRVRSFRVRSPRTGRDRRFTRIETADWVNVVAMTADDDVVLVRQWRHGREAFTLEIPGGVVDPGEDPAAAAARELLEETGYSGGAPEYLGTVEPNPAILTNRCHTYRIRGAVRVAEPTPDPGEDLAVVTMPRAEIPAAISDGRIAHALVICAFWWEEGRRSSGEDVGR